MMLSEALNDKELDHLFRMVVMHMSKSAGAHFKPIHGNDNHLISNDGVNRFEIFSTDDPKRGKSVSVYLDFPAPKIEPAGVFSGLGGFKWEIVSVDTRDKRVYVVARFTGRK